MSIPPWLCLKSELTSSQKKKKKKKKKNSNNIVGMTKCMHRIAPYRTR